MRYQLAMFFRDELVSWSWRRPPGMPAAPAAGGIGSAELKQRVTSNVDQVLTRIKNIAPQTFPEEVKQITFVSLDPSFVILIEDKTMLHCFVILCSEKLQNMTYYMLDTYKNTLKFKKLSEFSNLYIFPATGVFWCFLKIWGTLM